jgi:hypothetical protein
VAGGGTLTSVVEGSVLQTSGPVGAVPGLSHNK